MSGYHSHALRISFQVPKYINISQSDLVVAGATVNDLKADNFAHYSGRSTGCRFLREMH